MLRTAREDQSLSREDAAHEINLRLDQLDALERDQFERLPGDTFVRGYLRTYAKWLRLDVDKTLATYIEQTGHSADVSLSSDLNSRKQINARSDNGLMIGAALIVAVLILGFWLYNSNTDSIEELPIAEEEIAVDTFSGKPLEDAASDPLAEDEQAQNDWENPFTAAAEYNASVSAEAEIEAVNQVVESTSTNANAPSAIGEAAASIAPTPAVAAAAAASILTRGSGSDELFFTFTEDCWLEVSNASGRKVFSAVRKAGQGLRVRGTAPFKVVIGNAPAVNLAFNGQPVDVVSNNRRKMARLTLGQN
ncbi:MAG: RodZ domain-containing protein [Pseudomonadota bacterium]